MNTSPEGWDHQTQAGQPTQQTQPTQQAGHTQPSVQHSSTVKATRRGRIQLPTPALVAGAATILLLGGVAGYGLHGVLNQPVAHLNNTANTAITNTQPSSTEVDANEPDHAFSAEEIVIRMSPEGYVTIHGDHQHYHFGYPPAKTKFAQDLILPNGATYKPEDVLSQNEEFYIINTNSGLKVLYKDAEVGTKAYKAAKPSTQLLKESKELAEKHAQQNGGSAHADKQAESSTGTVNSKGQLVLPDGYVFDPKDIVSEDDLGYVVRHQDHFHYILKSDVEAARQSAGVYTTIQAGHRLPPNQPTTDHNTDHKHEADSDINNPQPTDSTKHDNTPDSADAKLNEQGLMAGSQLLSAADLARVQVFANRMGLSLSQLRYNGHFVIWPHEDHFHATPIDQLETASHEHDHDHEGTHDHEDVHEHDHDYEGGNTNPDATTAQGLMAGSDVLNEEDLKKATYFAEFQGLKLSQLQVNDGIIIWPHEDHYHTTNLSDIQLPKDYGQNNKKLTAQGLQDGSDTLSEKDLKKVDMIIKSVGFGRDHTYVKNGRVTISDPDKNRSWEYSLAEILLPEDFPKTEEVNEQGFKKGSDIVSEEVAQKIKSYIKSFGFEPADVFVTGHLVAWEHFDDIRSATFKDIGIESEDNQGSPDAEGTADATSIKTDDELEDEFIEELNRVAHMYNVKPQDIVIENGTFNVPHGDHSHTHTIQSQGWKIYLERLVKKPVSDPRSGDDTSLDREQVRAAVEQLKDDARYYLHDNPRQFKRVIEALNAYEEEISWSTCGTAGYLRGLENFKNTYLTKGGTVTLDKTLTPLPASGSTSVSTSESDSADDTGSASDTVSEADKNRVEKVITSLNDYYDKLNDISIVSKASAFRSRLRALTTQAELTQLESEVTSYKQELDEQVAKREAEKDDAESTNALKARFEACKEKLKTIDQDKNFMAYYKAVTLCNDLESKLEEEKLIELEQLLASLDESDPAPSTDPSGSASVESN